MNEEDKENINSRPVPPPPGEHQATVKDSMDLLKRLAEFNSKKEDVLNKLSAISKRMETRIDGANAFSAAADSMPEFLKHTTTPTRMSNPFMKFVCTRTRETPKPMYVDGCFNISLPNKQAITDEWKELMHRIGDHALNCTIDEFTDEGIMLPSGNSMSIPTGLKIAPPSNLAFRFVSFPGLTIVHPQLFTDKNKENELIITVRNDTSETLKLLYGIPLFTAYPIIISENMKCDELLNSTYEDWVHGTING